MTDRQRALEHLILSKSEVDLSFRKLSGDDISTVASALARSDNITKLDLSQCNLDEYGAKLIANALKKNTTLKELWLGYNNIGNSGAKSISGALKINKTLQMLHLNQNNIGDSGAKKIASGLKHNKMLWYLSLCDNKIGDPGAKDIAAALTHNATLCSIVFFFNSIGNDGADKIADALQQNNTVKWFYLESNTIRLDINTRIEGLLKINRLSSTNQEAARRKSDYLGLEITRISESNAPAIDRRPNHRTSAVGSRASGSANAREPLVIVNRAPMQERKRTADASNLGAVPFDLPDKYVEETKRRKSTIDLTVDDDDNTIEPDGSGAALRSQDKQQRALVRIKTEHAAALEAVEEQLRQAQCIPARDCSICFEPYNQGATETNDYQDRRPVMMPGTCGRSICLSCAELDRAKEISKLKGNQIKIKCMYCREKYHSATHVFPVNRTLMDALNL